MEIQNRKNVRKFIRGMGLMTMLGMMFSGAGLLMSGCQEVVNGNFKQTDQVSKQFFAMDTYMNIDIYCESEERHAQNEQLLENAVLLIQDLDDTLSTGNCNSEISQINAYFQDEQKEGMVVSKDTAVLIKNSIEIGEKTKGAFDITIYPVMKSWGFTDGNFRVPAMEEIEEALEKVDVSAISFDAEKNEVVLPEQVEIDLGGIAKGYTGEMLVAYLKEQGISSALLNLGGNVQALGAKPDGSDWKIGIKNPVSPQELLCSVAINDQAVITSGGYERYFEQDGRRYHHIIDPKTGYPSESGILSVSIISAQGMLADAYSTALFVMGEEKAISFWRENAEVFDFILYTEDGRMLVSEGIQDKVNSKTKFQVIEK